MAMAVNGFPSAATYMEASEIRVFPVPHSATTAAERASANRFTMPITATAWEAYGLRSNFASSGDGASCGACKGANDSKILSPISLANTLKYVGISFGDSIGKYISWD